MTKYFTLVISSSLLLIYILYSLIFFKQIKEYERKKHFRKQYINQLFSTIGYMVEKNKRIINRFVSTKLIISMKNLYGEKLLPKKLHLYLTYKINLLFFIILISLTLISISNQSIIFILFIIFIFLYSKLLDNKEIVKYKTYQENIKNDLPAFISRLYLLIQSGINLRKAIDYVIENSQSELSQDFINIKYLINNGMSELEAYNQLLLKSNDVLIRKFITNIIQNLQKGGDDLEQILQIIKKESDEYRRTQIILKTQEANSKLLIPNLMIFSGILIIVMLPLLFNLL